MHHFGLTSESSRISHSDLEAFAAVAQTQILRDCGPAWSTQATVTAFSGPPPIGYWPVRLVDEIDDPGALGYHSDENRQPYAVVLVDERWTITASHEILESLVDPFGASLTPLVHFTMAGRSISARVLREICDAPESRSYKIHGVAVSDFVFPGYYHELAHQVDAMHALPGPLTLIPGGYLSWINTVTGHWEQATFFGGHGPVIADLGPAHSRPAAWSLREWSDWNAREAKRNALTPTA